MPDVELEAIYKAAREHGAQCGGGRQQAAFEFIEYLALTCQRLEKRVAHLEKDLSKKVKPWPGGRSD